MKTMNRRASGFVALPLWLLATIAWADSPVPALQFTVVAKSDSVHRVRGKQNVFPWEHEEPGVVLVSNYCGFAEVKYRRVVSAANTERWTAYALLGEWCDKGDFVIPAPSLVAYRNWEGKSYIWDVAEIHVDDTGRRYVDDGNFIAATGLENIVHADAGAAGPGEDERVYLDELEIK
jgi:hypothetical protein